MARPNSQPTEYPDDVKREAYTMYVEGTTIAGIVRALKERYPALALHLNQATVARWRDLGLPDNRDWDADKDEVNEGVRRQVRDRLTAARAKLATRHLESTELLVRAFQETILETEDDPDVPGRRRFKMDKLKQPILRELNPVQLKHAAQAWKEVQAAQRTILGQDAYKIALEGPAGSGEVAIPIDPALVEKLEEVIVAVSSDPGDATDDEDEG